MNIVMINPAHPSTPHISAVRAWRFSQELAHRGHRVMLLTGSSGSRASAEAPLTAHDWRHPFVEACALTPVQDVIPQASGAIRRATTAVRLLRHGGRQGGWVREAVRAAAQSRQTFRPDVVWCTCGMLESAFAAKQIAAEAGRPWVLDIKDNWESLVPRGLRHLMARRIRGWAAMTANSEFTANLATKGQATTPAVIYSGVEPDFFVSSRDAQEPPARFSINVIGSVYFADKLGSCLEGLRAWWEGVALNQRPLVSITYLGADVEIVKSVASRHWPQMPLQVPGYVPAPEMARLCKAAAANTYIANPTTFHHKLLELLASGRPVIAFPCEMPES